MSLSGGRAVLQSIVPTQRTMPGVSPAASIRVTASMRSSDIASGGASCKGAVAFLGRHPPCHSACLGKSPARVSTTQCNTQALVLFGADVARGRAHRPGQRRQHRSPGSSLRESHSFARSGPASAAAESSCPPAALCPTSPTSPAPVCGTQQRGVSCRRLAGLMRHDERTGRCSFGAQDVTIRAPRRCRVSSSSAPSLRSCSARRLMVSRRPWIRCPASSAICPANFSAKHQHVSGATLLTCCAIVPQQRKNVQAPVRRSGFGGCTGIASAKTQHACRQSGLYLGEKLPSVILP